MTRGLAVASRVVLAVAQGSPNVTVYLEAAARVDVPVEDVDLPRNTGVRHALELCGTREIYSAHVPRVDVHPGEQLRKIIQAPAEAETRGLPVLAVTIVHPDAPATGPVVELDPAHTDAGFAALFAAGLAGTTRSPLHVLRSPVIVPERACGSPTRSIGPAKRSSTIRSRCTNRPVSAM
ncbi:hypothetical protein [Ilumatobacter sp.]|uniref:hypothetical protein n=1 Tax=Ilumatobacter sp. TaxID=1967498 RepID=UPI003C6BC301